MNQWISEELGGCELGDRRLVKRLKIILERMWQSPLASITAACRGFAEVMAASRFFGNDQVTQEQVLAPHREATLLRVAQHRQVLYIQDTTELDFTAKKKLQGAGPLSDLGRRGFFAHNELVVSPERLPLGLWHTSIDARKDQEHGKSKQRKQKPIQEKESYRWLEGYRRGCELAGLVPQSQVVVCADREADIYEIFALHQSRLCSGQASAHWLIRSNEDRCLELPENEQQTDQAQPVSRKIRQQLEQSPVLGSISFAVPAKEQTRKIKGSTRKSRRSKRVVTQQIRAIQVTLRPPRRKGSKLPPVTIRIVQAQEIDAPPGEEPINWILLTDLECCEGRRTAVTHRRVHQVSHPALHDCGLAGALCHPSGQRMSGVALQRGFRRSRVALQLGDPQRGPPTRRASFTESNGQNGRFLRWLFGPKERWPSRTKNPLDRVVPSAGFCFLLAANSPSALQRLKSSALQD